MGPKLKAETELKIIPLIRHGNLLDIRFVTLCTTTLCNILIQKLMLKGTVCKAFAEF